MKSLISNNHYRKEDFKQRMTKKQWETILLDYGERIIVKGNIRYLTAKHLFGNVVEVFKSPINS